MPESRWRCALPCRFAETHHVKIAPLDSADEGSRGPLDAVAPRLVHAVASRHVGGDSALIQRPEGHARRLVERPRSGLTRQHDCHARVHAVRRA